MRSRRVINSVKTNHSSSWGRGPEQVIVKDQALVQAAHELALVWSTPKGGSWTATEVMRELVRLGLQAVARDETLSAEYEAIWKKEPGWREEGQKCRILVSVPTVGARTRAGQVADDFNRGKLTPSQRPDTQDPWHTPLLQSDPSARTPSSTGGAGTVSDK